MNTEEANALLMSVDDLGFLSPEKTELLLGAIGAMPPQQKHAAMKKLISPNTANRIGAGGTNLSPRDEAMMRLGMLPPDIRKGLEDKRLQLVDTVYYTRKSGAALTALKLITNADTQLAGTSNLANGMLQKDNYMLLTAIKLVSGTSATGINDAVYGVGEKGVVNGEIEFKVNGKYLLPNRTPNKIFDTTNMTNVAPGYYRLANPKWIDAQQQIEANLTFSQALAANTFVGIELIGASVTPY